MANKKSSTTLNLGSQRVGMARFGTSKSGLVLKAYDYSELLGDPTAEAVRVPQTKVAVGELASRLKAGKKAVRYSVPGQSVFTRFVKLPPLGEDKIDEIVQFEAQQNVPFPLNEVVWDYQLVGGGDADEMEVALVAIKSDLLSDIDSAVAGNKLQTASVDVAPMALYNAFRYNYGEVTAPVLLIDLGSKSTNLIYAEGERLFVRNVPVGGATVTQAIAKELGLDFAAAEARKLQSGFVSLGAGFEEDPDPEVATISNVVRNTMTRIHGEVVRTNNLYKQQGGSAPTAVYLCGGGAGMAYMKEFFEEKLSLPVEYFNALRNVKLGAGVDAEQAGRDGHCLGELVGLALRDAGSCPMELEILPDSVQKTKDLESRKPYLFTAAACLLGTLAAIAGYNFAGKTAIASRMADLQDKVSVLEDFDGSIRAEQKKLDNAQGRAFHLKGVVRDRYYWVNLLNELNSKFANDYIWVTQITPVPKNGRDSVTEPLVQGATAEPQITIPDDTDIDEKVINAIHLQGLYHDKGGAGVANQFFESLKDSPYFKIDQVLVDENKAQFLKMDSGAGGDFWAWRWEMYLPLSREIPYKDKSQ